MARPSHFSPLVPLVGLLALVPDETGACSDPCQFISYFDDIEPIGATAIPIDGVLVLQATGNSLADPDLLASLEIVVTRDGQPIAGAVEATAGAGVLVWRPAQPFEAGTHQAVVGFPNPDNDDYGGGCGPDEGAVDFEFLVLDEPAEPLVPPVVAHEQSVMLQADHGLADLVCCDGAFPQDDLCGYGSEYWEGGDCAPGVGTGVLGLDLTVQPLQDAATSGQLLRTFFFGDEPSVSRVDDHAFRWLDHPVCTQVELRNLATGETTISPMVCHGDDVADQLGPKILDPVAQLAGKCEGPLYTCTIIEEFPAHWDPNDCTPFLPDETTDGPTSGPDETSGSSDGDPATGTSDTESIPTTGGETTSPTGSGTSETGETGGAGEGGQDGLVDHGCACDGGSGGSGGSGAASGLLALGLLALRRRRR